MENEIFLPIEEPRRVILVGDFHGEWAALFKKIDHFGLGGLLLISVGDEGVGFSGAKDSRDFSRLNENFKLRNIEFIGIRGNHSNPAYFDDSIKYSNFKLLKDYSTLTINGEIWQFVGGAISVDRKYRVEGRDFWRGEEFFLDEEKAVRCDVLVTHTGPPWIGPGCKGAFVESFFDKDVHLKSELLTEREELQKLYDICKPKKSFLGHFHRSETCEYHGEGYTCKARILDIDELYEYRK